MEIKVKTYFFERTNEIKNYLKEIKNIPIITNEEEKKLFSEFATTTDNNRKIEIRNEIIMGNQRFIFAIAKRYATDKSLNDLINEANLAAIEAFEAYDVNSGYRFNTIATYYIRRAINNYINNNVIVKPSNNLKLSAKVKKIQNHFYLTYGRYPSVEELIQYLYDEYGIEVKYENELFGANVTSIDSFNTEDEDYTFGDGDEFNRVTSSKNAYEKQMDNEMVGEQIRQAFKVLDEREAKIIKMSSGYGYEKEYKDKEIAEIIGLTTERVRQIKNKAKMKMSEIILSIR